MTRISVLILALVMTSCAPSKTPVTLIPVQRPAATLPTNNLGNELSIPLGKDIFQYDNSPEIAAAIKEFSKTGKAPIVKRAGFLQYPFGEVQPILNCKPNYGCDIQLQAGETVQAVILGNEPLWDYLVWESNQQFEPTPHVTIGPRVGSARTNAIIGTDRRTYHIELLSTTKSEYVRSAKFYYPRERLRQYQAKQRAASLKKQRQEKESKRERLLSKMSASISLPYQFLSFGWKIEADKNASWKPRQVFDDGLHIYLQFPSHVSFEDLPGIYAPTKDGKLSKPTWRPVKPDPKRSRERGAYLMVDGVFDELHLIGGFSGRKQKVVIKKAY